MARGCYARTFGDFIFEGNNKTISLETEKREDLVAKLTG